MFCIYFRENGVCLGGDKMDDWRGDCGFAAIYIVK
jgi:hypothetical protein